MFSRPLRFQPAVFFVLFLLLCSLPGVLGGCAKCPVTCPQPYELRDLQVNDLREIPQDLLYYARQAGADKPLLTPQRQKALQETFLKRFFSPWQMDKSALTAEQALWGIGSYGSKQGFGENKLQRDKEWMRAQVANARPASFPSLAQKAILVQDSAVRVFPTDKPFFYDFNWAGEGYPFDYFQNSALPAGTPVLLTHQSADGAWLFVESGLVSGWVHAQNTATVDVDFMTAYQTGEYAALLADDVPLRTAEGRFVLRAGVGALFPLRSGGPDAVALLLPVRDFNGRAVLVPGNADAGSVAAMPLAATPGNFARVATSLMGQPYGWGGLYGDRDCSALLRDLYTPFGIWLPRNSSAQAKAGSVQELEGESREAKERIVRDKGIPFLTLLGMRGHIMLYVGEYKGRAVVFQNIWGLRLQHSDSACERSGRLIIGRAVCTSLDPGTEVPDVRRAEKRLVDRISTMTFVGR